MKKMEQTICLTSIIVFFGGALLNALYSIAFAGGSFTLFGVFADAFAFAMIYMFCIWLNTRRYKLLACIASLEIALFGIMASLHFAENPNELIDSDWKLIILKAVVYIILFVVATLQSNMLIREETEEINNENKETDDNVTK